MLHYIPAVSANRLKELAERIKPVVEHDGDRYYIKPVDISRTAFLWAPEPTYPAKGLVPLRDVITYHTYAYYGFFKPTIAEVLKQLPADIADQVVAFEIVKSPESADDLNEEIDALNAGYHVATTRLYATEYAV